MRIHRHARRHRAAPIVVLALYLCLASSSGFGGDVPRVQLLDLDGKTVNPFADGRPSAFFFTRTDCPISNRYAPEFLRLYKKFSRYQVRFWLVYPDPDEPVAAIRRHLKEYAYPAPALRDTHHDLVRLTQATVTPEVAVFNTEGKMIYRGRIDNRFVDFGKSRPEATVHDLEDALDAMLAGRPVERATTMAVGCYIPDLE